MKDVKDNQIVSDISMRTSRAETPAVATLLQRQIYDYWLLKVFHGIKTTRVWM